MSNQKYREMQEQFKDVGLMTGDVTINPSASCIVMTTEVMGGSERAPHIWDENFIESADYIMYIYLVGMHATFKPHLNLVNLVSFWK